MGQTKRRGRWFWWKLQARTAWLKFLYWSWVFRIPCVGRYASAGLKRLENEVDDLE